MENENIGICKLIANNIKSNYKQDNFIDLLKMYDMYCEINKTTDNNIHTILTPEGMKYLAKKGIMTIREAQILYYETINNNIPPYIYQDETKLNEQQVTEIMMDKLADIVRFVMKNVISNYSLKNFYINMILPALN